MKRTQKANAKFINLAKNNGWKILRLTKVSERCDAKCPSGHVIDNILPENLKRAWQNGRKFKGCGECEKQHHSQVVELCCSKCEKKFTRKKSKMKEQERYFCSLACAGLYANQFCKKEREPRIYVRDGKTHPGEKYGDWEVLGKEFHMGKKWYVVCQCVCGFVNIVCVNDLVTNNNQNCGVCRQLKVPEISQGQTFGVLTVTSDAWHDRFRSGNKWRVMTKCKCGWRGEVSADLLLKGRGHHKGCKYYCQGKWNGSWKGCGDLSGRHWHRICFHAKKRKIEVGISIEEAWDQYQKQNGICALTGWELSILGEPVYDYWNSVTASLDRIDSAIGYLLHNIQWVHKDINRSKWCISQQQYVDYCHLVHSLPSRNLDDLKIEVAKRYKSFKGEGNLSLGYFNSIKDGSIETRYENNRGKRRKERGVAFDLSIKEAWDLYCEQGGRCALTGIPIYFGLIGYGGTNHVLQNGEATASLDRIDSNKGYVKGNVQWVHKDLNLMKYTFSPSYFKQICAAVAETHNPSSNVDSLLLPASFAAYNRQQKFQWSMGPRSGKFKGVSRTNKGYTSHLTHNKKTYFLGDFENDVEAAKNYDCHALHLYGKDAYLNFPDEDYTTFTPKRTNLNMGNANKYQRSKDNNKTGYKGIHERNGKYVACFTNKGKKCHLGTFSDLKEAAYNYDYFAKQVVGELAVLNFPNKDYNKFIPKRNLSNFVVEAR